MALAVQHDSDRQTIIVLEQAAHMEPQALAWTSLRKRFDSDRPEDILTGIKTSACSLRQSLPLVGTKPSYAQCVVCAARHCSIAMPKGLEDEALKTLSEAGRLRAMEEGCVEVEERFLWAVLSFALDNLTEEEEQTLIREVNNQKGKNFWEELGLSSFVAGLLDRMPLKGTVGTRLGQVLGQELTRLGPGLLRRIGPRVVTALVGLIWLVLLRRPMGPAGRKVVDAVAVSAVPFIMDFCAKRSLAETLGPSYSVLVPSVLEVALLRSQLRQALQA